MEFKCFYHLWALQWLAIFCAASNERFEEKYDHHYDLEPQDMVVIRNGGYPTASPVGTNTRFQMTAPLNYKVIATCYVNFQVDNDSCNSYNGFHFQTDGTTNLFHRKARTVCGTQELLVIISKYNSLVFGTTSKHYSGVFSCNVTTIAHREPCDCGWSHSHHGIQLGNKIDGGTRPNENSLASLVALYSENTKYVFCGGALITIKVVLTAAHCLQSSPENDIMKMLAMVGRDNVNVSASNDTRYSYDYRVSGIRVHPSFVPGRYGNDIGLVFTQRNVALNRGVSPICMPNSNDALNKYDRQSVILAGWGSTSFAGERSDLLLMASVTVNSLNSCKRKIENDDEPLYEEQICTTGNGIADACQYDSGAPVMYFNPIAQRYFTIGIVSYGIGCRMDMPAVNTRVSAYMSWIEEYADDARAICKHDF